LEHVVDGGLGGFALQRQMHALEAPVLLGMARLNRFDLNAEPEPPHGQFAEPIQRRRRRKREPVVGTIAAGRPKSLLARSKTVNANDAWVLGHASRRRAATRVQAEHNVSLLPEDLTITPDVSA